MSEPICAVCGVVMRASDGVFGLLDGVDDQAASVFIRETVEHLRALVSGRDHSGHAQARQMLRNRSRRFVDDVGEVIDRQLVIAQSQDDLHSSGIGKESEYLDGQIDELAVGGEAA